MPGTQSSPTRDDLNDAIRALMDQVFERRGVQAAADLDECARSWQAAYTRDPVRRACQPPPVP
ncbi:hypothetical protein [Streptomyces sp. NRRL B-3648]|uniref:hypothetical protein n=1 Tax=Streptomyces sp. NRRL B-3648 TaxID=1519493 RepID=UPI0006AE6C11|nr:hypothetical protein [Streptomyces sp. NRRL B-3648]KOV98858.1 hypothetical protein ADL04_15065 [Streptomyces sp. NRRL B-3648]